MKTLAKFAVVAVFGFFLAAIFLKSVSWSDFAGPVSAQVRPTPTPAANTSVKSNANTAPGPANASVKTATNAASPVANAAASAAGDKSIPAQFTLAKDSVDPKYGEVAFNHDNHAFKNYSPDGKAPIACVECHHTDQPKSALKPPLVTSEREVTLTLETWKASNQKVNECRSCHFQDGNVPEGKEMPSATYTEAGKSVTKDLNNELAYHINCNTCHDRAAALRPELKKKPGFATTTDCQTCHKAN